MRVAIIVQARMTSTRLPGKVLKEVLGKPLLEYLIERLKRVNAASVIVIATTTNDSDVPIVELCDRLGVAVTRGSEQDVLARYYESAKAHGADVVVRITSDCPVIDPAIIDQAIRYHADNAGRFDYVTNAFSKTYPNGMSVEVFSFRVLEEAYREASAEPEREHVTPFIYLRPERYGIGQLAYPRDLSGHRWTVDTAEDFELIRLIIEALYPGNPEFGLEDIAEKLNENPHWALINAHVVQKKLGE
ncbi:cytidylyltransferase domain-containing protein [Noviherbaspirillum saxi]|uniref:Acylneuraminate cytidylyltransferase n=1 Tax=Noviherbaspirillum saxi TaxID=2320863 RepID=A0A3A3FQX9_9BURK|nr:glycosyltransferase family protein [Noviherbaspirillum saxi]RJF98622.1 acylneuraminate cytidylyltransferase [Noviherbaspirillum saxi]